MSIQTHRQCTVEIQNKCSGYMLCNPQCRYLEVMTTPPQTGQESLIYSPDKSFQLSAHTISGSCDKPLPPTLSPSESGSALFIKTPHTACGSVGVFTYDLHNLSTKKSDGRFAVMFSVPYDFNLYSNWYAVGVFGLDKQCGKPLFEEMYNYAERRFVRGKAAGPSLTYVGDLVTIRAIMSDSYQPVMKIQVCSS